MERTAAKPRRRLAIGLASSAAAVLLLLAASPLSASPDDSVADWLKARLDRFPTFVAAQPAQNAAIAALKSKTAALIAAAPPLTQAALDRPAVVWRASDAPIVILDDPVAPRVAVVPAGEFTMGSPADEPGRTSDEGPRHRVRIDHAFAVSMFPIVYGEYAEFVAATHRAPPSGCTTFENGSFALRAGRNPDKPGFTATPRQPATCIGFADATAYAAWLTEKTGHRYRLLSEAEYEYIERAGTGSRFWWGTDAATGCAFANGFDLDAQPYAGSPPPIACHDGHPAEAVVGLLKANAFGLFDTAGNIASWTADCWNGSYAGAPTDGSAWLAGGCRRHVLRGGSWASVDLRAARRDKAPVDAVAADRGFRVVRVL